MSRRPMRASMVCAAALALMTAGCVFSSSEPSAVKFTASCPASVVAESILGQPLTITFGDPQVAGATPPLSLSCSPPSGSSFPRGTTAVACTMSDARQQTFSCNFTVGVFGPPRLSTSTILAFGDSLTTGSTPPDPVDSYPNRMRPKLTARYVGQSLTVINDGRAGESASRTGRTRLVTALDLYRPGALLLMEGSNDLLGGSAGATAGLAALAEMVRAARARNVIVLLATLPPQRLNGPRNGVARTIPAFNEEIKALAQREGATLVDIFVAMGADGRYIGPDDLHPTPQGFEVMAQAFFDAIRLRAELPPS